MPNISIQPLGGEGDWWGADPIAGPVVGDAPQQQTTTLPSAALSFSDQDRIMPRLGGQEPALDMEPAPPPLGVAQPGAPELPLFVPRAKVATIENFPPMVAPSVPNVPPAALGAPNTGWWNNDPIAPTPQFSNKLAAAGTQPVAAPVGTPTSPGQRLEIDFLNQGSAASQLTTPITSAHAKNIVSADLHESDAGEIMYRDPVTGHVAPADRKKHVALRDPADNQVKLYTRTPETDESALSALGRLLMSGMGAGAPTARPAVGLARATRPGEEITAAAERLSASGAPVQVPRAITTDSMPVQRAAATVRNVPFAGDPLVAGAEKAITQLGNKASEVAAGYGGGTTVGSGDAARTAIREYITGVTAQRASKLYDRVDNLVDGSRTVPLEVTGGVAREIMTRRGQAGLGEGSKAVATVLEAIQRPQGLTYQGLKDLRSAVGEMLKGSVLPEGMSQAELKQIYSALSDDLKTTVSVTGGVPAKSAFDRANTYYRLISDRREALAKIIGKNGDEPAEKVFQHLIAMASSTSRADIRRLAQARKAIGTDDWNEFASGVVAELGRSPAAKGAPEALNSGGFSPERFLTAYNKLSSDGRAMLFRSGAQRDLANSLDDIARVSSRFRELQKFSNPSGTAQNTVGGIGIGSAGTALLMGDVVTPLAMLGTVLSARQLATVLAKPSTARAVADFSKRYEVAAGVPTTPKIALLTLASRNLANSLKESGIVISPTDFLKSITGPVPARTDDDKRN
jgi:hypothetical protein